jgi:lipopolysaccharide/colanic/teichoic acid biosynthesis glycosyltransferase
VQQVELPGPVSFYQPEDLALFFTRAGATGLVQVAGRSLLAVLERISLDLRYVANQTLLLDIRILLATATAVVLRRGAF